MSRTLRNLQWLAVLGLGTQLLASCSRGQSTAPPALSASPTNVLAATVPAPVVPKCPVDTFRDLLNMTPVERTNWLAGRSVLSQKMILAKLREYEALAPDQRTLRLRATELRWYLLPLMTSPPTNRPAQLAAIPAPIRGSVEERLGLWDSLPADAQRQMLDHMTRPSTNSLSPNEQMRMRISPSRRDWLERGIREWQTKTEDERQKLVERFYEFLELKSQEKQQVLNTLSEPERRQLEKTLESFEGLDPDKRARCIESFEKFAELTVEEREQFLQNAQRWEAMTPSQRQAWKDVVSVYSHQPRPPLPRGLQRLRSRQAVATNHN